MTENIICPVCNNAVNTKFLSSKEATIYICNMCTVRFCYPVPSGRELEEFYKQGYFEGKLKGVGGYKDYRSIEKNLEKEALKKIRFIKKIKSSGKLLDIGAGTGVFAAIAEKNGFRVSANDISPFAGGVVKRRGIEFFPGPVKKSILPEERFDIVTAWDVIEHMADVNEMLKAVRFTLKKNGLFFVTTPDTSGWDAKLTGKAWYGYKKLPEHLIFFNPKSISELYSKHGLEVINFYQWGFYRSLGFVSEKISNYNKFFGIIGKFLSINSLRNISLFFPMTDFLAVARKK